MDHSFISPSSSFQWVECPGAPTLQQQFPEDEDTQAARDGRAAHWLAEQALTTHWESDEDYPTIPDAKQDDAGTSIDQSMRDAAAMYVNDIAYAVRNSPENYSLEVEWRLDAIRRINDTCFGTLDACMITASKLILWDFKYGYAEVSPVWNWQMLCYLAGVLEALDINGHQDQTLQVEFRIVQPRCFTGAGPIRSFAFTASDARARFNQLRSSAERALSGDPTVIPGSHCKNCSARHGCPGLRKETYFAADYVTEAIPERLSAEGLAFELALLNRCFKAMKSRKEAIETEAASRIGSGEFIPGYVTEAAVGNRKWKKSLEEVLGYGAMLGVNLLEDPAPVTPAEAARRLKPKGVTQEMLDSFVERPSLPPKLKPSKESHAPLIFNK